jgi:hypothetical protein
METMSMKFVWQEIIMFSAVGETSCGIHGPQFVISNLDMVDIFENIFDTAVMQLVVNEMSKYAQQNTSKSSGSLIFCSRIRKWKSVTLSEIYVVLTMFSLMGATRRSYYSKNRLLFPPFNFSVNSKKNEFQCPP